MKPMIFEDKDKLKKVYDKCNTDIQELFAKLIEIITPLSSSRHPSNKPDYRFKKGQFIYCILVLQPGKGCVKIELRIDKLIITSNIFDINVIADTTRPGIKWIEFKIYNGLQITEAIKIIKNVYDNFVSLNDNSRFKESALIMKRLSGDYLPNKDDFVSAYKMICPSGNRIHIDSVLDQIEKNAVNSGHNLKENWRLITERNIEIWGKGK